MDKTLAMHALKNHEPELAQAYVRSQPMEVLYPPEESLQKGTVFPCLSQPYAGWKKYPYCE